MPRLTNTTTRTFLGVATTVASLGIGVFSARAMNPGEESQRAASSTVDTIYFDEAGAPTSDTIDVEADVAPTEELELPLVAPVFVGDDPTILDQLLAGPPTISEDAAAAAGASYQGEGSEIIGAIAEQISFGQSGDQPGDEFDGEQIHVQSLPYVPDLAARYVNFPVHAYDICAGSRAGVSRSVLRRIGSRAGCPVGFAGTLNGLFNWPTPFIRGELGYHSDGSGGISQTCDEGAPTERPDRTAVTAFSSIPLTALRAEVRPHLTLRSWEVQFFPITSDAHTAHWTAEHEAGIFTTDALLPHCWTIDRDPDRSYDVRFVGTGIDGNEYQSEVLTLRSDTVSRPPTLARIWPTLPGASVTAWTVPGGHVRLTTRAISDDSDTSCAGGDEVDMSLFTTTDESPAHPVYEDWPRRIQGGVMLSYGATLLCAHIFDASNAEIGTDTIVLRTPTVQRPVITLEGVRLNSGVTIDAENMYVATFGGGLCSNTYSNSAALTGAAATASYVLWDCGLEAGETESIGVSVGNLTPDPNRSFERSIPISIDICDPDCPSRPAEWHEIPIPPSDGERCGEREGDFPGECTTSAGVAILKVVYQTTIGAPGPAGSATLVSSDAPTERAPVIRVVSTDVGPTDNWGAIPALVNIESDNVVTLVDVETGTTGPDACAIPATFDGAPSTHFTIGFTVCAGTDTGFSVTVLDDEGFTYLIDVGEITGIPDVVSDAVHSTIEFLGGDAPRFGFVSRFGATVDATSAALWGFNWSGTAGTAPGCVSLDDAVYQSDIDPRVAIETAGQLYAEGFFHVAGAGEDDCGDPSDAPFRPDYELYGLAPLSQLQAGEPLVFTTRPGVIYQVRITVTGEWHLELDGVRL
ncbi:MAG: hypothetical protein K8R99_06350 [Actinomycetia bacterium]|nr:hypothetical protein [Actinomycetes bacterium]